MNDEELAYLHARIDQLIRQNALEIGLLRGYRTDLSREAVNHEIVQATKRFRAADDGVAEQYGHPARIWD